MAASTGPILAAGGITWANRILFDHPTDWFEQTARIGVATGLAAGVLVLIDKAAPDLATALAYAALVTVLFVRIDNKTAKKLGLKGNQPTPLERALSLFS